MRVSKSAGIGVATLLAVVLSWGLAETGAGAQPVAIDAPERECSSTGPCREFVDDGGIETTPFAGFIDCADAFWSIACGLDDLAELPPRRPRSSLVGGAGPCGTVSRPCQADVAPSHDVGTGPPIRIDNDPICAYVDEGRFIICTTGTVADLDALLASETRLG